MAKNKLNDAVTGDVYRPSFANSIHVALETDFIPRDTDGAPNEGGTLGTSSLNWANLRGTTLFLNNTIFNATALAAPPNSIISGKVRTTSNTGSFLLPQSGGSFQFLANEINLVYKIDNEFFKATTDVTIAGVVLATSKNEAPSNLFQVLFTKSNQ